MALPKREVVYGQELQFFTNHVGHFILVTGLLDRLADAGRVVMVSSGAHHSAPSTLHDGGPLDHAIASAPAAMLGQRVLDRFGPKLPFLLKLLAAGKPLSLQAHPNLRQANSGHQRELRIGIDAAYRNYVDDNHKPELLVALTEFRAMCGFRDPLEAAADIEALGVPELGAILSCARDAALIEGFNPRLKLTRTETIMEGAASCDFRYEDTTADGPSDHRTASPRPGTVPRSPSRAWRQRRR